MASSSFSTSQSGARYLDPRHGRAVQRGIDYAFGQLPGLSNQQPMSMTDILDTAKQYQTPFTDINAGPVWTPDVLNRAVNTIYGDESARLGNQQREMRQSLAPGMGSRSPALLEMLSAAQGRSNAIGAANENSLRQTAQIENAKHMLNAQRAQTAVEAGRATDLANLGQIGVASQRDSVERENALLRYLASVTSPVPFSQSVSASRSTSSKPGIVSNYRQRYGFG